MAGRSREVAAPAIPVDWGPIHPSRRLGPCPPARPARRTTLHVEDHLHLYRRGSHAGHRLTPAARRGLRLDRGCGHGDPGHLPGRAHPGRLQ
ncbi:hypothetical protein ACFFX0_28470 [Citricoccus parietis]|uniref:Uncharacterized protein n=1 Tax=Citricoccus parietis TaxID=592307 RepID=A0ABV5G7H2_9MICC